MAMTAVTMRDSFMILPRSEGTGTQDSLPAAGGYRWFKIGDENR
jgi:hypothetical protein